MYHPRRPEADRWFPQIRDTASDAIFQLSQMKFESPNSQSEEDINGKFDKIYNDIGETFRRMQE